MHVRNLWILGSVRMPRRRRCILWHKVHFLSQTHIFARLFVRSLVHPKPSAGARRRGTERPELLVTLYYTSLPALCRSEKEGSRDCLNLLLVGTILFLFLSILRGNTDMRGESGDIDEHRNFGSSGGNSSDAL